jgi:hypothetical protein
VLDRRLDAFRHVVQRSSEPSELVVADGGREPATEVGGCDLRGASAHRLDGLQSRAREQIAGQGRQDECGRPTDQQLTAEILERCVAIL